MKWNMELVACILSSIMVLIAANIIVSRLFVKWVGGCVVIVLGLVVWRAWDEDLAGLTMVVKELVASSGQITPALLSSLPHWWIPILNGCTHWESFESAWLQKTLESSTGPSPTPNVLLIVAVCKNSRLYIMKINITDYSTLFWLSYRVVHIPVIGRQHWRPLDPSHSHTLSPILHCSKSPLVLLSHYLLQSVEHHHLHSCWDLFCVWNLLHVHVYTSSILHALPTQITPASSLWSHWLIPVLFMAQSINLVSRLLHWALDKWIGPLPSPKYALLVGITISIIIMWICQQN